MIEQDIVTLIKKELTALHTAGTKISEFSFGGVPDGTKYLCGANTGTNEKYTLANVFLGMVNKTQKVYFSSSNGVDDPARSNGTETLPYQTYEFTRQQCKLRSPSAANVFTIVGDGGDAFEPNFIYSPFINFDMSGGWFSFTTATADPDWATTTNGIFNFEGAQLSMTGARTLKTAKKNRQYILSSINSIKKKITDKIISTVTRKNIAASGATPVFIFDISSAPNSQHIIKFDNLTIIDFMDFNINLTDSTIFIHSNIFDQTSGGIDGTTNNVIVDNGNFFQNNNHAYNFFYTKRSGNSNTQVSVVNSVLQSLQLDTLTNSVDAELLTFNSLIVNSYLDNTNANILWAYDSISYRQPIMLGGSFPVHLAITMPQSIETNIPRTNYTPVPDPVTGTINLESEFEGIDNALAGGGGGGNVVGPPSAGASNIVIFDGTTGKLIKDSNVTVLPVTGQILFITAGNDLTLIGDTGVGIANNTGNIAINSMGDIVLDTQGRILLSSASMQVPLVTDYPNSLLVSGNQGLTLDSGASDIELSCAASGVSVTSPSKTLDINGENGLALSCGATGSVFIDSPNDVGISPDTGNISLTTISSRVKLNAATSEAEVIGANGLYLTTGSNQLYINNVVATQKTLFSTTWQGIWASPQSSGIYYTIIGDQVFLDIGLATLAVNATTPGTITLTTPLPVAIRPSIARNFIILASDNGINLQTVLRVDITGQIIIYGNVNFGNFTGLSGTGTSGFFPTSIRYFI